MDATTLLTQDHQEVDALFREFEQAGDRAVKTKQELVDKMISELTLHSEIEEEIFYPAIRSQIRDVRDEVREAVEEHHIAAVLMEEIKALDPGNEAFDAKVTVLIENIRHHKDEEEKELFPQVRKAFSKEELETLGQYLHRAKQQRQGHDA